MMVKIGLCGCDDSTYFEIEVTEEQKEFLDMLAAKSVATSTYGCMPVMEIMAINHD